MVFGQEIMRLPDDERFEQDLRYQPWTLLILTLTVLILGGGMIYVGFTLDGNSVAWTVWGFVMVILFAALFITYRMEKQEIGFTQNKRPAWLILYGGGFIFCCVGFWAAFVMRGATFGDRCKFGAVVCGLLIAGLHLKPMIKGR